GANAMPDSSVTHSGYGPNLTPASGGSPVSWMPFAFTSIQAMTSIKSCPQVTTRHIFASASVGSGNGISSAVDSGGGIVQAAHRSKMAATGTILIFITPSFTERLAQRSHK